MVDDGEQHVGGAEDDGLVDVQQAAGLGAADEQEQHH